MNAHRNRATDADPLELGIQHIEMTGRGMPGDDAGIEGIGRGLLNGAWPVPLTGSGEQDVASIVEDLSLRLEGTGIELDRVSLVVEQDAFQNQVFVPVKGDTDLGVVFNLDYSEHLHQSQGEAIRVRFTFARSGYGEGPTVLDKYLPRLSVI